MILNMPQYSMFKGEGVIVEPFVFPDYDAPSMVPYLVIGGVAIGLIAFFSFWFTSDREDLAISIISGLLFSCVGLAIGGLVYAAVVGFDESDAISEWTQERDNHANSTAQTLSEYSGIKVTQNQVIDSGLLELVGKDKVFRVEFSDETLRDPDTGEWMKEVRSFLIDGKVVEINSVKSPLEGEQVEKEKSHNE